MLKLIVPLMLMVGCQSAGKRAEALQEAESTPFTFAPPPSSVSTIALGSCNDQDDPQVMWPYIMENNPDLWIWLGDNVYADTEDMDLMSEIYALQQSHPAYQTFAAEVAMVGIWDDHDFGANDAGKEFPKKKASRDLMFEFLGVPKSQAAWQREGAYQAYEYGEGDQKVKVMLLDARYFRDPLQNAAFGSGRRYEAGQGDFLGEAQWEWLTEELNSSDAAFNIIGCGIQMIPEEHGWEKWANFPNSRERLFNTIAQSGAKGVILLSGDRHIAELSKIQLPEMDYPVYEMTSSGLTHTWGEASEEPNKHRVGELIIKKNFGVLQFDWQQQTVTFEVRGEGNRLYQAETVSYAPKS